MLLTLSSLLVFLIHCGDETPWLLFLGTVRRFMESPTRVGAIWVRTRKFCLHLLGNLICLQFVCNLYESKVQAEHRFDDIWSLNDLRWSQFGTDVCKSSESVSHFSWFEWIHHHFPIWNGSLFQLKNTTFPNLFFCSGDDFATFGSWVSQPSRFRCLLVRDPLQRMDVGTIAGDGICAGSFWPLRSLDRCWRKKNIFGWQGAWRFAESIHFKRRTFPKTKIAPKNRPPQREIFIGK